MEKNCETCKEDHRVERRSSIRETNIKLDQALNHLSDVLETIQKTNDKITVQEHLNTLRSIIVSGMVLTWAVIIGMSTFMFYHQMQQNKVETELKIAYLKIQDMQKEMVAKKAKDHNK